MNQYGNYLGILKWSLAQTDGTNPSEVTEMTEERKRFLMEAIESMTVDQIEIMKKATEELSVRLEPDASSERVETREEVLEELLDLVENYDNARDLQVIGGLSQLLQTLSDPFPSIQWRAADVLTAVVQNHPKTQKWAFEAGALDCLLELYRSSTDETVKAKSLAAMSSLTRSYRDAAVKFLRSKGLQCIAEGISSAYGVRGQRKGLFFLRHLFFSPWGGYAKALVMTRYESTLNEIAKLIGSVSYDERPDILENAVVVLTLLCGDVHDDLEMDAAAAAVVVEGHGPSTRDGRAMQGIELQPVEADKVAASAQPSASKEDGALCTALGAVAVSAVPAPAPAPAPSTDASSVAANTAESGDVDALVPAPVAVERCLAVRECLRADPSAEAGLLALEQHEAVTADTKDHVKALLGAIA